MRGSGLFTIQGDVPIIYCIVLITRYDTNGSGMINGMKMMQQLGVEMSGHLSSLCQGITKWK